MSLFRFSKRGVKFYWYITRQGSVQNIKSAPYSTLSFTFSSTWTLGPENAGLVCLMLVSVILTRKVSDHCLCLKNRIHVFYIFFISLHIFKVPYLIIASISRITEHTDKDILKH